MATNNEHQGGDGSQGWKRQKTANADAAGASGSSSSSSALRSAAMSLSAALIARNTKQQAAARRGRPSKGGGSAAGAGGVPPSAAAASNGARAVPLIYHATQEHWAYADDGSDSDSDDDSDSGEGDDDVVDDDGPGVIDLTGGGVEMQPAAAAPVTTGSSAVAKRKRSGSTSSASSTGSFTTSSAGSSSGSSSAESDGSGDHAAAASPLRLASSDACDEGDTFIAPGTLSALYASSHAIQGAVDSVMDGDTRAAFAVVRPPGHHCGARERLGEGGLGFCLINNAMQAARYAQWKHATLAAGGVAAAAAAARQRTNHGAVAAAAPGGPSPPPSSSSSTPPFRPLRIAIVDIDAHVGNGTDEILRAIASQEHRLHEHAFWYMREPGESEVTRGSDLEKDRGQFNYRDTEKVSKAKLKEGSAQWFAAEDAIRKHPDAVVMGNKALYAVTPPAPQRPETGAPAASSTLSASSRLQNGGVFSSPPMVAVDRAAASVQHVLGVNASAAASSSSSSSSPSAASCESLPATPIPPQQLLLVSLHQFHPEQWPATMKTSDGIQTGRTCARVYKDDPTPLVQGGTKVADICSGKVAVPRFDARTDYTTARFDPTIFVVPSTSSGTSRGDAASSSSPPSSSSTSRSNFFASVSLALPAKQFDLSTGETKATVGLRNPGSTEWRSLFARSALPILSAFAPDLIIISAGFDAHQDDLVGLLNLDSTDYEWVGHQLASLLPACGIVSILEGGYSLGHGEGQGGAWTPDIKGVKHKSSGALSHAAVHHLAGISKACSPHPSHEARAALPLLTPMTQPFARSIIAEVVHQSMAHATQVAVSSATKSRKAQLATALDRKAAKTAARKAKAAEADADTGRSANDGSGSGDGGPTAADATTAPASIAASVPSSKSASVAVRMMVRPPSPIESDDDDAGVEVDDGDSRNGGVDKEAVSAASTHASTNAVEAVVEAVPAPTVSIAQPAPLSAAAAKLPSIPLRSSSSSSSSALASMPRPPLASSPTSSPDSREAGSGSQALTLRQLRALQQQPQAPNASRPDRSPAAPSTGHNGGTDDDSQPLTIAQLQAALQQKSPSSSAAAAAVPDVAAPTGISPPPRHNPPRTGAAAPPKIGPSHEVHVQEAKRNSSGASNCNGSSKASTVDTNAGTGSSSDAGWVDARGRLATSAAIANPLAAIPSSRSGSNTTSAASSSLNSNGSKPLARSNPIRLDKNAGAGSTSSAGSALDSIESFSASSASSSSSGSALTDASTPAKRNNAKSDIVVVASAVIKQYDQTVRGVVVAASAGGIPNAGMRVQTHEQVLTGTKRPLQESASGNVIASNAATIAASKKPKAITADVNTSIGSATIRTPLGMPRPQAAASAAVSAENPGFDAVAEQPHLAILNPVVNNIAAHTAMRPVIVYARKSGIQTSSASTPGSGSTLHHHHRVPKSRWYTGPIRLDDPRNRSSAAIRMRAEASASASSSSAGGAASAVSHDSIEEVDDSQDQHHPAATAIDGSTADPLGRTRGRDSAPTVAAAAVNCSHNTSNASGTTNMARPSLAVNLRGAPTSKAASLPYRYPAAAETGNPARAPASKVDDRDDDDVIEDDSESGAAAAAWPVAHDGLVVADDDEIGDFNSQEIDDA